MGGGHVFFFTDAQKIQRAIHPDWILIKDFFFFIFYAFAVLKKKEEIPNPDV